MEGIDGLIAEAEKEQEEMERLADIKEPKKRQRDFARDSLRLLEELVADSRKTRRLEPEVGHSGNENVKSYLDELNGMLPFTEAGSIKASMEEVMSMEKWALLQPEKALNHMHTVHTKLVSSGNMEAGKNAAAVLTIAQFAATQTAAKPLCATMVQAALKEAMEIATNQGCPVQGTLVLWIPFIKHSIDQIAALTARVEKLEKSNPSYGNKREGVCPNCSAIGKSEFHTLDFCRKNGTKCNLPCRHCPHMTGEAQKHWYRDCTSLKSRSMR